MGDSTRLPWPPERADRTPDKPRDPEGGGRDTMQLFGADSAELTPLLVVANLLVAFGLGYFLSIGYRLTRSGFSYSQSFNFSIIIMSIVIAAIIMVIGRNIALSLGLVGSLSILRFRTAIKDSRDMMFLFIAILIGLAAGTSNYWIAGVTTVFCWSIILAFYRWNFGGIRAENYIVMFHSSPENEGVARRLADIRQELVNFMKLSSSHQISPDRVEYTYLVRLKPSASAERLTAAFSAIEHVERVNIITPENQLAI